MNKKKIILLSLSVFAVAGSAYGMKYYYDHFEKRGGKIVSKIPKLSQEDKIRNIIKKNLKDIQDCYNQRLEDGLDKNGKLKISWDINEIGIASNFNESDNELNDTELYDCSSHAISKWRFPEGIYFKINYTFKLKQKEKGDRQTASTVE
ncbi:MAG: AgmX/PglI C-terminal domain-containing protein [Bdellovibrionota bacterium]